MAGNWPHQPTDRKCAGCKQEPLPAFSGVVVYSSTPGEDAVGHWILCEACRESVIASMRERFKETK